jgi:hypothetical protein
MPTINPFENLNRGFTLIDLTAAIDNLPPRPSRITNLGLFADVPLSAPTAMLELRDHSLVLIPTTAWNAPPPTGSPSERKAMSVIIPRTAWSDSVLAIDVMGIRKFGTDSVYETIQEKVLDKLQDARHSFDATNEFRQLKALQGKVLDSDGSSLFDSYGFFGVTQKTVNFAFNDPTFDVRKCVRTVKRYVGKNLRGESLTGFRAFVGSEFFDALVAHPSLKEALLGWQGAQAPLSDRRASGFDIEGVVFEEYSGGVPKPDGTGVQPFLADAEGFVVPFGTINTFKRFLAPAARVDTANTLGKPFYAWQDVRPDKSGIDI